MWISGGLLKGTRGVLRSLGEDRDLALLSWSPGGKLAFARKSAVRTTSASLVFLGLLSRGGFLSLPLHL